MFLFVSTLNILITIHFIGCGVTRNYRQRMGIWNVWYFKAISYQTVVKFIKCTALKISTNRQMFYIPCCMLGFIHYQLIINILQSLLRSIEALLFPKKLVFRVGKKAVADRQALLQFWVVCWLVRIANVLGCVGRQKIMLNLYLTFYLTISSKYYQLY
jgi:hypothetical protein